MGLYIGDENAEQILGQLEGADWLKAQRAAFEKYPNAENFFTFQACYKKHHPTLGRDWKYGDDTNLTVIYGREGVARYAVTNEGEIVLLADTTYPEKREKAKTLGVRVTAVLA